MKTTKTIIGIVSICLSVLIVAQSFVAGLSNALSGSGEVSGSAGLILAFCMLIAGIVGIATRSTKIGGFVSGGFYAFGGLIGIANVGTYSDLKIWSVLAFIFAVVFILGSILKKKPLEADEEAVDDEMDEPSGKEKTKKRKKTGRIILIVVLVVIALIILLAVFSSGSEKKEEEKVYEIGETWTVDNQWSLTVLGVTETTDRNEYSESNPAAVYIVNYEYTNLGYEDASGLMDGLYFSLDDQITDVTGAAGYSYPDDIENYPQETPIGASCTAQTCIGVDNAGNFQITVSKYDGESKNHKATFNIDLNAAPVESKLTDTATAQTASDALTIGETWTVDGQWEFTVTDAVETDYRNPYADKNPGAVYIVSYTYKNLGYEDQSGLMDGLYFGLDDMIVDSAGVMGYSYPGEIDDYPQETPIGASCNAQACIGVDNEGTFTITVTEYDGNLDKQSQTFRIEATGSISQMEEEYADAPDEINSYVTITDVPVDSYCYDAVSWAAENGIIEVAEDGMFYPDNNCTRAEILTYLWKLDGEPESSMDSIFEDVTDSSSDTYKAVMWAVEYGITSGTSDTTFSPDDIVTRGQVVTFLWRYAGEPGSDTASTFADVTEDNFYYDAIAWAVENEITSGTSDTTFSPDDQCSRGQVITFLYRYKAYAKHQIGDLIEVGNTSIILNNVVRTESTYLCSFTVDNSYGTEAFILDADNVDVYQDGSENTFSATFSNQGSQITTEAGDYVTFTMEINGPILTSLPFNFSVLAMPEYEKLVWHVHAMDAYADVEAQIGENAQVGPANITLNNILSDGDLVVCRFSVDNTNSDYDFILDASYVEFYEDGDDTGYGLDCTFSNQEDQINIGAGSASDFTMEIGGPVPRDSSFTFTLIALSECEKISWYVPSIE